MIMEIFEKIGDAASKTYKFTAEKTSKIAKETKIKMQINQCKDNIKEIYVSIGEAVYEKYVKNETIDIKDLEQNCEEIQTLSDKIVAYKNELLTLKERRQCKNCYEEIDISAKYCPNCGYEQEEIIVETKEVEETEKSDVAQEETEENKEESKE